MVINNFTIGSLIVLLWNANGVLQHLGELEYTLNSRRIDIALITETHLKHTSKFYIRGYNVYRADHPLNRSQGGAAVVVKSNIQHYVATVQPPTTQIQAAGVTITLQNITITISAVYCPPRFNLTKDTFDALFSSFGPLFVAGGDYNAKHIQWGSRITNPRGRALLSSIQHNNYETVTGGAPTYWPSATTKLPDLIDFFVCKGINHLFKTTNNIADLSSDHSPILFILDSQPSLIIPRPSLTNGLNNWDLFRTNVAENINLNLPLKTHTDLENAIEHFTTSIQSAAWRSSDPIKSFQSNNTISYPLYIRELIQEKRRARGRWQRTRHQADKQAFNRLSNRLKREICQFKKEKWQRHLESLSVSDNSIWRETKRILKHSPQCPPLRRPDQTWAKTDIEKADLFSEHLSNVFKPNDTAQDQGFRESVNEELNSPMPLSLPPKTFSVKQVLDAIKKLPLRKSPGYDLITAEVLRELPYEGILLLTEIYNAILRTTHFPIQWKLSEILLFQKPEKPPHLTSSYRPISLLSVPSKLFEKLFLSRLTQIFDVQNAIPQHQFGFRKAHSTIHQLHRVVDFVASGLEEKKYTSGVFLDVSAAFDKVWHEGLLFKLKKILCNNYYPILKSFLEDRFFRVRQGSAYSDFKAIEAGVPQGAILSPVLYNIFTSDLPLSPDTMTATYADDTVILASSDSSIITSHNIQEHIHLIDNWLKNWKIKVNSTKSTQVTFTLRRETCPPVRLDNTEIPQTNSVRYLGLHLDRRLTWAHHIKCKRLQLNSRLKLLHRLLNSKSPISTKHKLILYKSLLRPIWTYGIQLFGTAKKSNLNKLQAFQSKLLRLITGAPAYVNNRTLHHDLNIPFIDDIAKKLYRNFHDRTHHHTNALIEQLSRPHNGIRRLRRMWSRDLLD